MEELRTVGQAAAESGWSARMLRYLERHGLVQPRRTAAGYRLYGLAELNRLRSLRELRRRFGVELGDLVFARRLRRSEEHTSELQSHVNLVCRPLLVKKNVIFTFTHSI